MTALRREKIVLTAVPLLAVVLIAVWVPSFKKMLGGSSGKLVAVDEKKLQEVHDFLKAASLDVKPQRSEYAQWGRDPFNKEALAPLGPTPVLWSLKGIFWDENNPSAIIGETVVVVGDRLNGFLITDIQPDFVMISDGSSVIKLTVSE